jgi:hypothetical protein
MNSITNIIYAHTGNSPMVILGGHYAFPDNPDNFALNSIQLSAEMRNIHSNSKLFSFINDMRYDNLCNFGLCNIKNKKPQSSTLETIIKIDDLWNKSFDEIQDIERSTGIDVSKSFIDKLKQIILYTSDWQKMFMSCFLENYKQNVKIDNRHKNNIHPLFYMIEACEQYNANGRVNDRFIWSVDYFMYYFDKDFFIPITYSKMGINCKTIFEKNVYNISSKVIRKLYEKNAMPNLITELIGAQTLYKCKSYTGNDIVLRIEDNSNNFSAINKCPSIIATLYYKIVKENCKPSEKFTVVYMVPAYDRNKVDLGAEAFFKIYYPYLKKEYKFSDLKIFNVHWGDSIGKSIVCDLYTEKDSEVLFFNT